MTNDPSPDSSADQVPHNAPPETPSASPPPPGPTGPTLQTQPVEYATPVSSGYPGPYNGPAPDNDSRTMAMLTHLLGIFTGFLGPLIIWLVKKDEKPFVDDQGKEALNFHLTMLIASLAISLLGCLTLGLGFLLIIPLVAIVIIFGILGTIAANKGEAYRYPVNIRMIR